MCLKEGLTKVTLGLLVLSILTLSTAITPMANASGQTLTLSPTQGPAGTIVYVIVAGFDSKLEVKINYGTINVATSYPIMFGRTATSFTVPSVSPGTYTVTATDAAGGYATATFTVTAKLPTATATATPTLPTPTTPTTPTSPTETTWSYPIYRPTPSPVPASVGFWSSLVISVILTAVATFTISIIFMYRRRSKHETYLNEELPLYKPEPSAPSKKPTVTTRYNQPSSYSQQTSKPTPTTRTNQPPSYSQLPTFTKICPRCKQIVKDDYNLCPYCDKKLR
jgi:hypothetical protein